MGAGPAFVNIPPSGGTADIHLGAETIFREGWGSAFEADFLTASGTTLNLSPSDNPYVAGAFPASVTAAKFMLNVRYYFGLGPSDGQTKQFEPNLYGLYAEAGAGWMGFTTTANLSGLPYSNSLNKAMVGAGIGYDYPLSWRWSIDPRVRTAVSFTGNPFVAENDVILNFKFHFNFDIDSDDRRSYDREREHRLEQQLEQYPPSPH